MNLLEDKEGTMANRRTVGLAFSAAGAAAIAIALLFGLTTEGGGPDWVGIITVVAGAVLVVEGLVMALRGGGSPSR